MTKTKRYARILRAKYESRWYADKFGEVFELTGDLGSFYSVIMPEGVCFVKAEDAELIVTEKRPAKVGERILIVNDEFDTDNNGQIHRVCCYVSESTVNNEHIITDDGAVFLTSEYEVIVNNEVKNEEDDEMKNVEKRYDTAVETARDAIEELRLAAYAKGYEDARRELMAQAPVEKTSQELRDEIVEQAKADVERLRTNNRLWRTFDITFDINRENRTVEAIAKKVFSRTAFYGTAICAPDDCFNEHIGKAIAIHRALGLEVPEKYLNAPQPTEVREGDVVRSTVDKSKKYVIAKGEKAWHEGMAGLSSMVAKYGRIIDDSRTEVGE
ncbi:hypothetical protein MOC17_16145 [Bacillus haynesii]|uniref:hypothetical protein n=1 Tax=Bacillus haynesii TaxID=1925021 RepID=UPI00227EA97A|nr:hypothetical protein [Bacillus haynesii]MCY8047600.1 hypothetical protein [Bacillus haynesii]